MIISSANDPKNAGPNGETKGDVLKRIQQEYGKPEEKNREPVKKLGKDDFFKIMVTQIKNQDPTSPYKNEQMAAQMAQFTGLEQMFNVNQNLEKLTSAQTPLHHLGAAALIGKAVTVDGSQFSHTEGKYSPLNFNLPVEAGKVKVAILNAKGEVVQEIEKSNLKAGPNSIEWDGRKTNNLLASSGTYSMRISAENPQGKSINVTLKDRQIVKGVAFEGADTLLICGDEKDTKKVYLKTVSQIEDLGVSAQKSVAQKMTSSVNPVASHSEPVEEKNVEGAVVGQAAQFAPFDMKQINMPDKPLAATSTLVNGASEKKDDLSDANPVASGRINSVVPNGPDIARGNLINPAAEKFYSQQQGGGAS